MTALPPLLRWATLFRPFGTSGVPNQQAARDFGGDGHWEKACPLRPERHGTEWPSQDHPCSGQL
jgi:hypothetical protein